jgi:hypothetical protein
MCYVPQTNPVHLSFDLITAIGSDSTTLLGWQTELDDNLLPEYVSVVQISQRNQFPW